MHKNPPLSLFQGCRISRSTTSFKVGLPHRPRCPSSPFSLSRVLSKLSTLPPMVTPSEVSLFALERKLHGSPHRLMPSFIQDRTSTPSARPRSTQRGFFASRWWLCWRLRRLYPRTFSSNSYVTYSHLIGTLLFNSRFGIFGWEQENISSKIGLILSFSLILLWGARLPVVCGSFYSPRSALEFSIE